MKKLVSVLLMVLALNFIAAAAGIGWLFNSGHLDKAKAQAIRDIVFPPTSAPTTQPDSASTNTQTPKVDVPTQDLNKLLARMADRSPDARIESLQTSFDMQNAALERRAKELVYRQSQLDKAIDQAKKDRDDLAAQRKALQDAQAANDRQAQDQGFQDSLKLYTSMTPAQVKKIFVTLDEETMTHYLQAMPARTAAKIIKEFKTPDELERIHRVLERMRQAPPTTQTATAGG